METFVAGCALVTVACAIITVGISMFNARKLDAIHMQYNSRMDELITQVGLAKLAEGRQFERDQGDKP